MTPERPQAGRARLQRRVHVLLDGRIVKSGGKDLALQLEDKGYAWIEQETATA